jgi:hypothetical protein
MKAKFSIMLTAFLMLFGISAHAEGVLGDVNGDGKVDNGDIEVVVKIITGDSDNPNGDVTGDGKVNVADIVAIVNIMMTPPSPPSTDAKVNITIKNTTSKEITISSKIAFFLSSDGKCIEVTGFLFDGGTKTIASGGEETFSNIEMSDSKQFLGLHFASSEELKNANIPVNNVVLYDQNWNSTTIVPDMIDVSEVFTDGGSYPVIYSKETQPEDLTPEDQTPEDQTPVDPTPQDNNNSPLNNPVITIGIELVNNTGTTVTLDGDIVFVMSNPDHNGNYFGRWSDGSPYTLSSNRTDHIRFSGSSVTLAPNDKVTFGGLRWQDSEFNVNGQGGGMGEKSPLHPSLLPSNRPRNVLVYVDGNSEVVLCDNMDPNIIFRDGETYTISLSSNNGAAPVNPTPTPVNPPQGNTNSPLYNPVITIGINLINRHGSPVYLDGDIVFVMSNPDHNGNYFGRWSDGSPYTLSSNRTGHIYFSSSPLIIGAGEKLYFGGLRWQDDEFNEYGQGGGMGEKSPLHPSLLPDNRPRNVLLYQYGISTAVLCENMDPNIIFQDGGVYNIIIQ